MELRGRARFAALSLGLNAAIHFCEDILNDPFAALSSHIIPADAAPSSARVRPTRKARRSDPDPRKIGLSRRRPGPPSIVRPAGLGVFSLAARRSEPAFGGRRSSFCPRLLSSRLSCYGWPAALLLGPMAAAIVFSAWSNGSVRVSQRLFIIAQGDHRLHGRAQSDAVAVWRNAQGLAAVRCLGSVSVVAAGSGLGWLLARLQVLPGTVGDLGFGTRRRGWGWL